MTLDPLLTASPAIQIHAVAALAAFVIGGAILFRKKGGRAHRVAGRIWVILMVTVAMTSFFIWTIRLVGLFSPIHLLSIATLISLTGAVRAARAGRITIHKSIMQQTYLGALIIAGFFTFMPGRIMHHVLFGTDNAGFGQWVMFLSLFAGMFVTGYAVLRRRLGWRLPRIRRRV